MKKNLVDAMAIVLIHACAKKHSAVTGDTKVSRPSPHSSTTPSHSLPSLLVLHRTTNPSTQAPTSTKPHRPPSFEPRMLSPSCPLPRITHPSTYKCI